MIISRTIIWPWVSLILIPWALSQDILEWKGEKAAIQFDPALNQYTMTTTAPLRGRDIRQRSFPTSSTEPQLRTGNHLVDGTFALALEEAREARPAGGLLREPGFNFGRGIFCDCFETGELWKYVWTRDISYSVHLALGLTHPRISLNSLLFKISGRRDEQGQRVGEGLEIVQDTGTGGSWPVSTDRVVWALGARELLNFLQGEERSSFLVTSYEAIKKTLQHDRQSIYDPEDGLYRGELSFFDWREQSYPLWSKRDPAAIAMSKALTTNILHFEAMVTAEVFAQELGHEQEAREFHEWGRQLKEAIRREFWFPAQGLYRSFTLKELNGGAPIQRFDLLGQSLAILSGVATAEEAQEIVQKVPHSEAGAPVQWPQLPSVPIYHNRAIWPFVSAYFLMAAGKVKNDQVANRHFETLIRGAALNLSHMENFELFTQASFFADGDLSGPVINSRRQLWSLAGHLGVIFKVLFGLESSREGVSFRPFLTQYWRHRYFRQRDEISLTNISYRGKILDVRLLLPPATPLARPAEEEQGYLSPVAFFLNGRPHSPGTFLFEELESVNQLDIQMAVVSPPSQTLRKNLSEGDYEDIWAPHEPRPLELKEKDGRVHLKFSSSEPRQQQLVFDIFRNGRAIARGLRGKTWTDVLGPPQEMNQPFCYTVESRFLSSGNTSLPTKPQCYWPEGSIQFFSVSQNRLSGPDLPPVSHSHGRIHFSHWGGTDQILETSFFSTFKTGKHFLQILYGNGHGPVETGISAGAKRFEVWEEESQSVVGEGVMALPQWGRWDQWGESGLYPVSLRAGRRYKIILKDHFNMSYLQHFALYTQHYGGYQGPNNRINVQGIKVLRGFD